MRILFIHCAYKDQSGEDFMVREEISLLRKVGAEVELLLFDNQHHPLSKLLAMPFNLQSYKKTKAKVKSFAPDVVHVHNLHFAASASVIYAVKKSRVPLVCTLHNFRLICPSAILFYQGQIFKKSLHQSFPWTAVKRGVFRNSKVLTFWLAFSTQVHRWLGTWALPDRLIVLSKHAQEIFTQSMLNIDAKRIVVKPNFCSPPVIRKVEKTKTFLFAGRLYEDKGVPLLLKAFASLPHCLIIAGDGPMRDDVVSFCKDHPNVSYVGPQKKDDLLQLMQSATALIFPSIWYEGMPLTIIEAFACGLPVIASKLGVMEHMIEHGYNGLQFTAGQTFALTSALNLWANLPEDEIKVYRENALRTYEHYYTPEKNTGLLLSIYASVIKKPVSERVYHIIGKSTNTILPILES